MAQSMTLSSEEIKVWSNLVTKGISNALAGLSQMTSREISVTSLSVKQIQAKDAPDLVGGADKMVVGIYLAFTGDAHGHILLVQQPELAFALVDMLMGNKVGSTKSIEAMEQSALAEMGNITGSFFLNALADSIGLTLHSTPPTVVLDMAGAILDVALADILQESEDIYVVETTFHISGHETSGTFLVMPTHSCLKTLLRLAGA